MGAISQMRAIIPSASSISLSGSTTRFTMPSSRASSALRRRAVNSSSLATAGPTRRARRQVPP